MTDKDGIADIRNKIRANFIAAHRFEFDCESESETKFIFTPKNNFSAALVAFWHSVLGVVVGCEQFIINEAEHYEKAHNLDSSAWLEEEFKVHINKLYETRHTPGASEKQYQDKMVDQYLFSYIWTMRFEPWFDGLPFNVNYTLQIMLRFEEMYVASNLRKYGSALIDTSMDGGNVLFRRVWHKIMYTFSFLLNTSFAFFLYGLIDVKHGGCRIYWDREWRVANVFTISGSRYSATSATRLSQMELAAAAKYYDIRNKPSLPEVTWIAVLLQSTDSFRMVHCSLTSDDSEQSIFVRPHLPFFVIQNLSLSKNVIETLQSTPKLHKEMLDNYIADEMIVMLHKYLNSSAPTHKNKEYYRVDLVRECQPIGHRIAELHENIEKWTQYIAALRKQHVRLGGKKQGEKKEETQRLLCAAQAMRNNTVALFVLLFSLASFYSD